MELGGFSAWVSINDTPLGNYNTEFSPDGKSVTCWIASEAGKNFTVHWADSLMARPTAVSGFLSVDGVSCGGKTIRAANHFRTASSSSLIVSQSETRPFLLSVLELTDDDSYLGTSASMKLGEISISIWRTALGARHVASSSLQPPEDPKVHERSKKAFSHRVKFGEAVRQAQPIHTVGVQKLDREPLVTFIFKYRSLDVLRANGIVQAPKPIDAGQKRKASPGPSAQVKDEQVGKSTNDSDEEQEARILEERLNAIRSKRMKTEKKMKPVKTERENNEQFEGIIDLTAQRNLKTEKIKVKREMRQNAVQLGDIIDLT